MAAADNGAALMFRDTEVEEALRRVHRQYLKGTDALFTIVKEAVLAATRAGEPGCLVTVDASTEEFDYCWGSDVGEWAVLFVAQNRGMKEVRYSGPDGPLVSAELSRRGELALEHVQRLWFSWYRGPWDS
jgi:hypothetical protein